MLLMLAFKLVPVISISEMTEDDSKYKQKVNF